MPLNLSNREQNSGHLFYNRRLRAAITRFSVRMKHDDRKQYAAVALSMVFVMIGCGWMALLHIMKPAGLVGRSPIVGNRDTGALYTNIDGRLYPTLNLTSAQLAVGSHTAPVWVKGDEIAKYPTGPTIGIPGAPDAVDVSSTSVSAWSVCDTAAVRASTGQPVVTAIAGDVWVGDRARAMQTSEAILATHREKNYVIWNGRRSEVDLTDRAVMFTLGIDVGVTFPVVLSHALFNAMPATEPLVVPVIPDAGAPSRWLPGAHVGQIMQTRNVNGGVNGVYVLLADGVQKISEFVADVLRTADSQVSGQPWLIPPDKFVGIPQVHVLSVDFYPTEKLYFVDTQANPVTCVGWRKQVTDRQAVVTLYSGRGLPIPQSLDSHIVTVVRDDRSPDSVQAQQTLFLPGAANFVMSTSANIRADTRETLLWISPQGVRYGIDNDEPTMQALGVDPQQALQAPWPLVQTFAAGPALSRASALIARDTIKTDDSGGEITAVPGVSLDNGQVGR